MSFKLKRHTYTSTREKIIHILIGLFSWAFVGFLIFFLIPDLFDVYSWIVILFFIGGSIYYAMTKQWIAVGLIANVLINLAWGLSLFGFEITFDFATWLFLPFPVYMMFSIMQ